MFLYISSINFIVPAASKTVVSIHKPKVTEIIYMSSILFVLFLLPFTSSVLSNKDNEIVLLKMKKQATLTVSAGSSKDLTTMFTHYISDPSTTLVLSLYNVFQQSFFGSLSRLTLTITISHESYMSLIIRSEPLDMPYPISKHVRKGNVELIYHSAHPLQ